MPHKVPVAKSRVLKPHLLHSLYVEQGVEVENDAAAPREELERHVDEFLDLREAALRVNNSAAGDAMAVVDPECRGIGVDGLRVADSSIFPQITNGNLNAPSIMVGEKASDHILGKTPLPAANQEPWIHPDWQSSQR